MRAPKPIASPKWKQGILPWILTGALLLQLSLYGQRATDADNPDGKWEVLHRCRLLTNALVDGDSFQVAHQGREYSVRLYFVDAPESDPTLKERAQDQAAYFGIDAVDMTRAGKLAAKFMREKLSAGEFTVITRWQNAMGRGKLARFYCEVLVDGKDLGEELVANGLARIHGLRAIRPDGTRATTVINQLKNRELTAREQKRGVWDESQFPRIQATGTTTISTAARVIRADAPLDLNTASYEDLQNLPGIGPKLAERIIAHRPYKKFEELDKVPGLGKLMMEKLMPLVRVEPRPGPK